MKTRIALDQSAILGLLRDGLPTFGYDLDSDVAEPMQVKYCPGERTRYCAREGVETNKIVVSVSISANAPWLPEGRYKSLLPCDLYELREILRYGLHTKGVVADTITFAVHRVLGRPHLVAEYIA